MPRWRVELEATREQAYVPAGCANAWSRWHGNSAMPVEVEPRSRLPSSPRCRRRSRRPASGLLRTAFGWLES